MRHILGFRDTCGERWGGSSQGAGSPTFSCGPKSQETLNLECCYESVYIPQAYAVWENLDCALFSRIISSELGWRDMGAAWSIWVSEIFFTFPFPFSPPHPLPSPSFPSPCILFAFIISPQTVPQTPNNVGVKLAGIGMDTTWKFIFIEFLLYATHFPRR